MKNLKQNNTITTSTNGNNKLTQITNDSNYNKKDATEILLKIINERGEKKKNIQMNSTNNNDKPKYASPNSINIHNTNTSTIEVHGSNTPSLKQNPSSNNFTVKDKSIYNKNNNNKTTTKKNIDNLIFTREEQELINKINSEPIFSESLKIIEKNKELYFRIKMKERKYYDKLSTEAEKEENSKNTGNNKTKQTTTSHLSGEEKLIRREIGKQIEKRNELLRNQESRLTGNKRKPLNESFNDNFKRNRREESNTNKRRSSLKNVNPIKIKKITTNSTPHDNNKLSNLSQNNQSNSNQDSIRKNINISKAKNLESHDKSKKSWKPQSNETNEANLKLNTKTLNKPLSSTPNKISNQNNINNSVHVTNNTIPEIQQKLLSDLKSKIQSQLKPKEKNNDEGKIIIKNNSKIDNLTKLSKKHEIIPYPQTTNKPTCKSQNTGKTSVSNRKEESKPIDVLNYDSYEEDDFIVKDEDDNFKRKKSYYYVKKGNDESDDIEEVNWEEIQKEEEITARIAELEDYKEYLREKKQKK